MVLVQICQCLWLEIWSNPLLTLLFSFFFSIALCSTYEIGLIGKNFQLRYFNFSLLFALYEISQKENCLIYPEIIKHLKKQLGKSTTNIFLQLPQSKIENTASKSSGFNSIKMKMIFFQEEMINDDFFAPVDLKLRNFKPTYAKINIISIIGHNMYTSLM